MNFKFASWTAYYGVHNVNFIGSPLLSGRIKLRLTEKFYLHHNLLRNERLIDLKLTFAAVAVLAKMKKKCDWRTLFSPNSLKIVCILMSLVGDILSSLFAKSFCSHKAFKRSTPAFRSENLSCGFTTQSWGQSSVANTGANSELVCQNF